VPPVQGEGRPLSLRGQVAHAEHVNERLERAGDRTAKQAQQQYRVTFADQIAQAESGELDEWDELQDGEPALCDDMRTPVGGCWTELMMEAVVVIVSPQGYLRPT